METEKLLQQYQKERNELLERLVQFLLSDQRVTAAWLIGSLGRGNSDALSDIDLWAVIKDEAGESISHSRSDFIEAGGEPLLRLVVPQNAPVGGAYELVLYPGQLGTIQVDWYWQIQSKASRAPNTQLLFDRIGLPVSTPKITELSLTSIQKAALLTERLNFFWSMSQIAAKKVARQESWPALNMINMIGSTLEELKWLVGIRDNKPDYTYQAWNTNYIPLLPIEQLSLLQQQQREIEEKVMPLVGQAGGVISWPLLAKVKEFYSLVEELIKENVTWR